jgi:hypothetical protein
LKIEQKVKVVINNGDTLIQMDVEYARLILKEVLNKKITDSILTYYIGLNSLNIDLVSFQFKQIKTLLSKQDNYVFKIGNLKQVVNNKDIEITTLNSEIKLYKKEIRKQKVLKIIGLGAAIVLPILVLLIK